MHKLFDGARQQALIEAAAAKAAQKIRPNSTHKESLAAKRTADSDSSSTADFQLAPVRPHAAHGDRGAPDSDDEHERLLTAAQVKRRYGNASDMWLWRRLHDSSGFPQPLFICGRRFWRMAALIAWERARAKGGA
ncbi:MAG TPA: hypothetical protein VFE60_04600 [Roseiarcus sp.]|nr:hypothetical protein [Roseiarcus sp.]